MTEWTDYTTRAVRQHGARMDWSEINETFVPYFHGPRIKVRIGDTEYTGRVGVTAGWRPALLLMRRSSDHGSSILLTEGVELLAVQRGRQYVLVNESNGSCGW
jgi:hypothetical protein